MSAFESTRPFKRLTPQNWDDHDPTGDCIGRFSAGEVFPISETEWASAFLSVELSERVPADVRHMFEVAQGVMCYGCRFYPLYTLGCEQLFRVLEAAVHHRCEELGAPKGVSRLQRQLEWLFEQGILDKAEVGRWDASRRLRNHGSHPRRQSIYSPDMAASQTASVAALIEDLFSQDVTKPNSEKQDSTSA